ncbi:MAG: hypothetical protein HIU88_11060 [Acidobacteria bacterium]|nr:hypothetical protein [Acidobacteriota bacterium]
MTTGVPSAAGAQYTEGHVPQTVAKQVRQRAIWDVALSIALLVVSNGSFLIGAIFAMVGVGFSQACSAGCNTGSVAGILFATGAILAFVGLLGSILTIVALVRRRRAWWIALTTVIVIAVGWIAGFLVSAAAMVTR